METGNSKGPEKVFGKGVRIAVWRNNGAKGSFPSLKIERRYKDKDGNWQSGTSFTVSQALRLYALLGKAICEYVDKDESSDEAE
jgi:hypothetical protein